jgi:hypothetical protein
MVLFRLKRRVNAATSLWYYTVVPFFSQDGTQNAEHPRVKTSSIFPFPRIPAPQTKRFASFFSY